MVILTPLKIIQVVFTGLTHQISEYALALAIQTVPDLPKILSRGDQQ